MKRLPIEMQVGEVGETTVTLTGQPVDTAALLETLHMLINLGFPVVGSHYDELRLSKP